MKQLNFSLTAVTLLLSIGILFNSCHKKMEEEPSAQELLSGANHGHGHLNQTKTFSSDVARKWMDMQLRILRLPAGVNPYGLNGVRNFAYCGVALYEAVVPGMPSFESLSGRLTDMPTMPDTEPGKSYHWPTSANAALAYMNKHFYTVANTPAYQASMDSLENALNTAYQLETDAATFQRSKAFGTAIAEIVFNWSTIDGSQTVYPTYVPPPSPLWNNTPPNPIGIVGPYWGKNRLFVAGSTNGTDSPLPPSYSEIPGSPYYEMVKEVYDISQSLTPDQKASALYFLDDPGYKSGTHYLSIFGQIMNIEKPQLDSYAWAQVYTGISMADAMINCWKIKYTVLLDRPTRYIRNVLGHTTWTSFIPLHPHPDFPSGHAQNAGAFSAAMTKLFGSHYQFTIHTYDNLGLTPRSYNSFNELANDVAKARVYGGIHYTYSCVEGKRQGEKIACNVFQILRSRNSWRGNHR